MKTLIGIAIGLMINHFIIKPIEREAARKECIEDGLVPNKQH